MVLSGMVESFRRGEIRPQFFDRENLPLTGLGRHSARKPVLGHRPEQGGLKVRNKATMCFRISR